MSSPADSTFGQRIRPLVPVLAWIIDLILWLSDPDQATSLVVPLASAAVCATLYARARHPVVVLTVQLVWSAAAPALPAMPLAGLLVALYAVAATRRPAVSLSGLILAAAVLCRQLTIWGDSPADVLIDLLAVCLVAGGTWALGHRSVTMRAEAAAAALRVERLRIARELHDIVAHAISGIVLQAAGARAVLATDPDRAAQALQAIEGTSAQAVDEMHRMLGLLRSAGGDTAPKLDRQPGLHEVGNLLDWARANGLTPTTVVKGEPGRLDDSTSLAAYRLVQEAMTNTLKHAGPGTAVELRLSWSDTHLTVSVEDHRPGSSGISGRTRHNSGHGLLGLHERVSTVGGTFTSRARDHGFVVTAQLPLAKHEKRPAAPAGGPVR
jgi:signal transduction histidine kinase